MTSNRKLNFFSLQKLAYAQQRQQFVNAINTQGCLPDDLFAVAANATDNQLAAANDIFQDILLDILLHAVMDNKKKAVQVILDAYPELLLLKAKKGLEIQSKYTWLVINAEAECALSIAVKLKQINMIELLLPYYDQLEQTNELILAKMEALAEWQFYEFAPQQDFKRYAIKPYSNNQTLVIPQYYMDYAQSIVDAFAADPFEQDEMNEQTRQVLNSFFEIIIPKKSIKLADYLDPELLLHALLTAYAMKLAKCIDSGWASTFCVNIIGLMQSILMPESAMLFCKGLRRLSSKDDQFIDDLSEKYRNELEKNAALLQLGDHSPFYRTSRTTNIGLGSTFYVDDDGDEEDSYIPLWDYDSAISHFWEKHLWQKQQQFTKMMQQVQQPEMKQNQSRCSIL